MKRTLATALQFRQLGLQSDPSNYPGELVVLFPQIPLIFDGFAGNVFELWLNSDALTTRAINMSPGFLYTFIIRQSGAGTYRFTWPANVHGAMDINPLSGSTSTQTFVCKPEGELFAIVTGSWT
jgi:hypothetical protein